MADISTERTLPLSRRQFLSVLGASAVVAVLPEVSRAEEEAASDPEKLLREQRLKAIEVAIEQQESISYPQFQAGVVIGDVKITVPPLAADSKDWGYLMADEERWNLRIKLEDLKAIKKVSFTELSWDAKKKQFHIIVTVFIPALFGKKRLIAIKREKFLTLEQTIMLLYRLRYEITDIPLKAKNPDEQEVDGAVEVETGVVLELLQPVKDAVVADDVEP